MSPSNVMFHPIICSVQKLALYETKDKIYIVGSNNAQTRFRLLTIDRRDATELNIVDDKIEYGFKDISNLVNKITAFHKARGNTVKVIYAFGIVGFIRFLHGYYIILITKRRRIAEIGLHILYKIEDTNMIPISTESKNIHPNEAKYVKMFQSIDLKSNFYFSYSYDLTRPLQNNVAPPKYFSSKKLFNDTADYQSDSEPLPDFIGSKTEKCRRVDYGFRRSPRMRFVWNSHLLKPVELILHPDWILYITHGFIDQLHMSIFGRPVYIAIIARRSNKFAGTRFLKRGANFSGDVANEVETEQIVYDSGTSSLSEGRFSSFVQMRGSIPGHWSQDISKMVPKPPISLDLSDPYRETSGAHFNRLLKHYGSPIIILNLVKKREKKRHESILTDEILSSVKYLNQFLPPQHRLHYIHFDMARKSRDNSNVMKKLAKIAQDTVLQTGMYISPAVTHDGQGRRQTGIIRINCVDCLDRTNTAQFAVGKCAMAHQLYALGLLDSPLLQFDSDCVQMLEGLYEDHGDTLALQYGGSQLVHRIKTYRKTAPWTSQGNDIMQTLSRYYSNTFSDADKQNTINLFLGYFIPSEALPAIWELTTDFYMHNPQALKISNSRIKPKTQWWNPSVLKCLPNAYSDEHKSVIEIIQIPSSDVDMVDVYADYHRPHELSTLQDLFAYMKSNTPYYTSNNSPFVVRSRSGPGANKNPSVSGQSSTSSTSSTTSSTSSTEASDSSSDDEPGSEMYERNISEVPQIILRKYEDLLPPMRKVYGCEPKEPDQEDLNIFKRYVAIQRQSTPKLTYEQSKQHMLEDLRDETTRHLPIAKLTTSLKIVPNDDIPNDSVFSVKVPIVPQESIEMYQKYVESAVEGFIKPHAEDLKLYKDYVIKNSTVSEFEKFHNI